MVLRKVLQYVSTVIVLNFISCEVYRLPNNVRPIKYILTMEPNLEQELSPAPYNGSVIIQLKVLEDTRNIILHYRKLTIDEDSIEVVSSSGVKVNVSTTSEDHENEIYIINLESDLLKKEEYVLKIGNFTNNLGHSKVGFYLAKYRDKNKVQRRLAVTDFEPSDARMAFPCFDEPGIKAKFVINLIRKAEHNSVSNQELESTIDLGNGRFQDIYKETPDMPAYLVAFAVSDYKHTEKLERHRIFGRPDDVDKGGFNYSLEISVQILQALEEYTDIPFALDKMDQFAVPDIYFKDEAMENWGLVIYGESHLLCTNTSAAVDLKRCTSYISHEFAHQWFGNLVTPEWWDYTWLSESFASYYQYYIASIVQPTWRYMDQFVIDNLQFGLWSEVAYRSSPLNYHTKRLGEFPPLNVLYAKGAGIVRMMEHFLTHDVFKKGIQFYLQNRKFNTGTPSDLYYSLQNAVHEEHAGYLLGHRTVSTIMETWDSQDKYPVITATRNYTARNIIFEQETFERNRNSDVQRKWIIPINYAFQSSAEFLDTRPILWLAEKNLTINSFLSDGWLVINKQQIGYYRVNYDIENWERLISFLHSENFKLIHVLNRAQLIDDSFNLAKFNYIPYDIPLRLSDYLIQEKDYIPFAAFYNKLAACNPRGGRLTSPQIFENYTLKNTLASVSNDCDIFKEYVRTTLSGLLNYLGFEEKQSDTFLDKLNRAQLAEWLCRFKHPKCISFALKKIQELKENNATYVAPDIEETILCEGMRNATEEEFDSLHRFYNMSTDIYQRRRLYGALNCGKFAYEKLYG